MLIRLTDDVNGCTKFVNIKYITAILGLRRGETLVEYIGGCCYSNSTPEDLVLEIERINNEENE